MAHYNCLFINFICAKCLLDVSIYLRSVIVPYVVACENGDLSDVNNHRATAVSNALSKQLESVL